MQLSSQEDIIVLYHMDKSNWITILLDGTVQEAKILDFLDMSYDLTDGLFIFLFWQVISPFVFYNDSVNRKEMNFHEKQIPIDKNCNGQKVCKYSLSVAVSYIFLLYRLLIILQQRIY